MMLTILHDTHEGTNRVAGTTKATQELLKAHIHEQFKALLPAEGDLMILGDLFDGYNVSLYTVFLTYRALSLWLSAHPTAELILVPGNHDLSKTSTTYSSFELLANLLRGPRVQVIMEPTMTKHGFVIPHLPNQEAFEGALKTVPACDYLFLHVNYDNSFAAKSDQSLNLSKEQAQALPVKHIVIAHEHHYRQVGKVTLPGNQIASSVSDWITSPQKGYATIADGVLAFNVVRQRIEEYVELPWQQLEITSHKFVRVVGTATAEEATAVISAIATFRQTSPALVISNAVEVAVNGAAGDFTAALEAAQGFDVWTALGAMLEPSQMTTLRSLK